MEEQNKYIEIAKKLKALADKGIDGERYNAKKQLDRILKKHDISFDMLEDDTQYVIEFKIPRKHHELFLRIGMSVTGVKRYWARHKKKLAVIYASVTRAEEAEILAKWNFYSRVWEEQLEMFMYAFTYKNELFPKDVEHDTRSWFALSEEERKRISKIRELAGTLDPAYYKKQIK